MKKDYIFSSIMTSALLVLVSGCSNVGGISSEAGKVTTETAAISTQAASLTEENLETQNDVSEEYTADDVNQSAATENTTQEESTLDPNLNYITLRTSCTTNNPDAKWKSIEY